MIITEIPKSEGWPTRDVSYATAGSFVDGITGDDSTDWHLEDSAEDITENPVICGIATRSVAEKPKMAIE